MEPLVIPRIAGARKARRSALARGIVVGDDVDDEDRGKA